MSIERQQAALAARLNAAIQRGYRSSVAQLLAQGAQCNVAAPNGPTPIVAAGAFGSCSSFLFDADSCRSLARSLAELGDAAMLEVLLDHGATLRPHDCRAAFMAAARKGNMAVTQKLLSLGRSCELASDLGTAVHEALDNGHRDVAVTLLQHGALLTHKDKDSNTALHRLAMSAIAEPTLRALLEALPLDPPPEAPFGGHRSTRSYALGLQNKRGYTPLMLACEAGRVAIVRLLLDMGSSLHATDSEARTPLTIAARCRDSGPRREAIVHLLLAHGAERQVSLCDSMPHDLLHDIRTLDFNADWRPKHLWFRPLQHRHMVLTVMLIWTYCPTSIVAALPLELVFMLFYHAAPPVQQTPPLMDDEV